MPSLVELLYGGGTGRYVSSQTNQNGAGIVELEDVAAASPYSTFGGMYGLNGAAPATNTTVNTIADANGGGAAGPSAEYVAMMAEKYPGTAWGVGDRPSLFHQFIPGHGWVFMPEYDEGNNLQQQYQNMTPAQYTDAMDNGYTHQMSAASQAAADATGTTVTTGPAFVGGSWNNPANAVQATTPSATGGTEDDFPYTLADINALYLELLGRDGIPANMEHWLNDLRNGQTLEQVRANIMLSPEYIKRQEELANNDTTPTTPTAGPPDEEPVILGWYWGNSGGTWQWFSYIEGEAPPAGAYVEAGEAMPNGPPAGWVDPNAGDTTTTTETAPEPTLYTPTKDQFFQGMFSANDLMFRDGGAVSSTYYDNLRQGILDSLAQTALDNGRTQNTAEEIALAQGGYNGYSASGLFDPTIAGTAQALGLY